MIPKDHPRRPKLLTSFRALDAAAQDCYREVLDHCDDIRQQAEQRIGSTAEHDVVDDNEYSNALDLFNEVFELKTRLQQFHTYWFGND